MENKVIITDTEAGAGALVYWRLSGPLDAGKLRDVWEETGLPAALAPDAPVPSTALARACSELRGPHTLARTLANRSGHAIVQETARGESLGYNVDCRVRLDAVGRAVFTPPDHPMAPTIRTHYERHLKECSPEDVSGWLTRVVIRKVQAVALRDTGGVYFIPPHKVEEWRRLTGVLSKCSAHRVFEIPAMRSESALDAILDAIEQEAVTEAERMEKELEAGLGERAITTRLERCDKVEAKVAGYEAFLGRKLDTMRTRLEELRAKWVAAQMAAESAAEAAE